MATCKRTKEVSSRRQGIDACLKWLDSLTKDDHAKKDVDKLHDCITFEADQSGDHDGIGVYATKSIPKGETILSFPIQAALTLDHELFAGPELSRYVDECRQALDALIDKDSAKVSPRDRYAKMKGRVLLKNYLLLSFLVTLLWMEDDDVKSSPLQPEISKARQYWSFMMETEPHDWSHVPLLWTKDDLEMIGGTSFHALTERMQQEMNQVFQKVFLPTLAKYNDNVSDKSQAWNAKFQLALAFIYSHTHSKQQGQDEDMKLAADGLLRLNLEDHNNNKSFVEPIPICFPIVDLINGTRRTKDSNGELIATATSYQVVATRDVQEGEELFLCYGEDTLNNLDFFVKFGYIPLKDGCPVLVEDDFVTLPLGPSLRPLVVGDPKIKSISKLDQLRWTELEKYDMGKDRLVEPIPYFQRPFYVNGNIEAARRLRNSSAFSGPGVSIPQMEKMEQYVMTMLAGKQALKKLSEGKMPPPPMLDGWEPGQYMIRILDYYLEEHTTLSETSTEKDLEASKTQTGNQQLASYARMVEREIVLIWRHAIASHHGLYRSEKAQVDRLPKSNQTCCVQCRTSLRIFPCPKCGSVFYCSEACQNFDWDQGQHSRLCALFAAKNKK